MFGQYHSIYWALISLSKGCPPLEEFQNISIFGEKCPTKYVLMGC